MNSLANKIHNHYEASYMEGHASVYSDIDEILNEMDKKQAIEVVEDFIQTIKCTYPKIAFGHFAEGFCTAERDEDKDKPWGDGDKTRRFYCWPSCNACADELEDGYGLLNKALKIIKEKDM
jgi:hypothetical protein|tara:strand:- start:799 stop:1161 length:363 start_codon:yes stop_codon:yes gene_type:complete